MKKIQKAIICPECKKVCKSKTGLAIHMNGMHLMLSPTQQGKAEKYLATRDPIENQKTTICEPDFIEDDFI